MIDSVWACLWGGSEPSSVVDVSGGKAGGPCCRARRAQCAAFRPPATGAIQTESLIQIILSAKAIEQDADLAHLAEAEADENRARHRRGLGDEHRRAAGDRIGPARGHKCAIRTATASLG